jgi:hypothetical protein
MELAEEEIPIIILPDESTFAAEFAPESTAAYPAEEDTQIVDLPPARQPVEYSEQALEEARGFLDGLVPPEAPPGMVDSLLSFEEVEAQINEELLLDKAGKTAHLLDAAPVPRRGDRRRSPCSASPCASGGSTTDCRR